MKNTTKFAAIFLAAIVVAGLAGGCKENKKSTTIEFESYQFSKVAEDTTIKDEKDKAAGLYDVKLSGVLPIAGESVELRALRDSLERLASVKSDYDGVVVPIYSNGLKGTSLNPDSVTTGNEQIDMLSVVLATPKVIVWENYNYTYFYMAAHGLQTYSYINYSLSLNKILGLEDLFKQGYETQLTQLLQDNLKDNASLLTDVKDVKIPEEFRITPDGIEFVWQVYEIAPYSEGAVRVTLPAYDLLNLLNKVGKDIMNV